MEAFANETDEGVPEVLTKAWEHALEKWDDPARHDELIRLINQNDAYAWAARRYRTRPDEIGTRALERIRKSAEASLMATAMPRKTKEKSAYRATTMMMIALVLLAAGGLVYAMVIRDRGATPTPPSVTPSSK
jgi:hypothetical protein